MAEFEKTSIDETINNFIKYTQGKNIRPSTQIPHGNFRIERGR